MPDNPDNDPKKTMEKIENMRKDMQPHLDALLYHVTEAYRQLAADMGEPVTDETERYWAIFGNLQMFGGQVHDSASPALHAVHDLARSVPKRSASQWVLANAKCDELFDNTDGGETLGLEYEDFGYIGSDHRDFNDEAQRNQAMQTAARFFSVPSTYAPAVGEVATMLMQPPVDASWRELPQPWADAYFYVVACICARIGAESASIPDGQHRPA